MVKHTVIPQFEVIQGGKDPDFPITKTAEGPPKSPDWLRMLPFETRFLCKRKNTKNYLFDNYGVAQVTDHACLLYNFQQNAGYSPFLWVDTNEFSRNYELIEILPIEEGNNGQHNLPPPEPRQVDDGHEGPA